jgi:cell division topological specificity factor
MNLWDRLFGRQTPASKDVAKERLQVVLVYDRARIEPGLLEMVKNEIISGISKHIDVDQSAVQISLAQEDGQSHLVANIPLKTRTTGPD